MPTPNAPPEAAVNRFAADLTAIAGSEGKIVLAVSGGPDSLALLLLGHAACPGRIVAATVDHGLRTESAAEVEHVRRICAALGVGHWAVRAKVSRQGNVSDRARTARYIGLESVREQVEAQWIATAHHAEDQLETFLMRANRGSGVGGLAGIRRRNGHVIRPLLGWSRDELATIVAASGYDPVDDPTNRDQRYDRARLRAALADADWLDARAVAQSAAFCDDATAALDWVAARLDLSDVTVAELPDELARRAILYRVRHIDPDAAPALSDAARALDALRLGKKAMLGKVVCTPGPIWRFAKAPPRRAKA